MTPTNQETRAYLDQVLKEESTVSILLSERLVTYLQFEKPVHAKVCIDILRKIKFEELKQFDHLIATHQVAISGISLERIKDVLAYVSNQGNLDFTAVEKQIKAAIAYERCDTYFKILYESDDEFSAFSAKCCTNQLSLPLLNLPTAAHITLAHQLMNRHLKVNEVKSDDPTIESFLALIDQVGDLPDKEINPLINQLKKHKSLSKLSDLNQTGSARPSPAPKSKNAKPKG